MINDQFSFQLYNVFSYVFFAELKYDSTSWNETWRSLVFSPLTLLWSFFRRFFYTRMVTIAARTLSRSVRQRSCLLSLVCLFEIFGARAVWNVWSLWSLVVSSFAHCQSKLITCAQFPMKIYALIADVAVTVLLAAFLYKVGNDFFFFQFLCKLQWSRAYYEYML